MRVTEKMREDGLTELTVEADVEDIRSWLAAWSNADINGDSISHDYDSIDFLDSVSQNAAKRIVMQCGSGLVLDEKIPSPLATPRMGSLTELKHGEPFTFTIVYAALPQRELSSYEPVKVRLPKVSVTEEEVTEQLEEILKTVPPTQERPEGSTVENGDTVEISMEATTETGAPFEALSASLRQYRLGDNFLPQAFDEALIGLKVGDDTNCDLLIERASTEESTDEKPQYTPVTVHLTLLRILREDIASIDDEFVRQQFPGMSNVRQLREGIRKELFEAKCKAQTIEKTERVVSELAQRIDGGVPDAIYEAYYAMAMQNLEDQLASEGTDYEHFLDEQGVSETDFRVSVMLDIRNQFKNAMALDAYAHHLGIEVQEEDIEDFLSYVGTEEGPEAAMKLQEAPFHGGLVESVRRHLAQDAALKSAIVEFY